MISPKYIHEKDNDFVFENACEEDSIFFEKSFTMLSFYDKKFNTLKMFKEDTTEVTNASNNIFKAIGQKILDIIERLKEFVKKTFDKIKEDLWNKKDADQKIKEFCKKYPEKAASLEVPMDNEIFKIKIQNSKDLKDFYTNIDKVLEDVDRIENPDTLKNRIKSARDRFDSVGETVIKVGAVAAGVASVIKLVSLVHDLNSNNDKSLNDIRNMSEAQAKKYSDMAKILSDNKDATVNMRRKATILSYATSQVEQVTRGTISNRTKLKYALSKSIDTGIRIINRNSTSDNAYNQATTEINKKAKDSLDYAKSTISFINNNNLGNNHH